MTNDFTRMFCDQNQSPPPCSSQNGGRDWAWDYTEAPLLEALSLNCCHWKRQCVHVCQIKWSNRVYCVISCLVATWQMTQCLASKRTGQVKAGREVQSRLREHGVWWAVHEYRPFWSWLSILVSGTGNWNHIKSCILLMSLWPNRKPVGWNSMSRQNDVIDIRKFYEFQLLMPVYQYGQPTHKDL